MKNQRKNSGFTLIELVVVVAIIGVLAAVVTPRIRTSLMKAKDAKVVATLDALRTASNVYYAEKGIIPYSVDGTTLTTPANDTTPINLGHILLLVKNGYLDKQSAQKLTSTTITDAMITTPTGSTGTDLLRQPIVSQDSTVATNCNDDNSDGILDPQGDAANTQGFAGYVWAKDGIGINVVTYDAATAGNLKDVTKFANTSCELWSSK